MKVTNKKKLKGFEAKQHFSNCLIPSTTTEGRLMAINDKYLAIPWGKDKGQINIIKSNNPTNLNYSNLGIFKTENKEILDLEFSPFNSNILAFSNFSNDNSSVMISSLREEKNGFYFTQMKYREHTKKVNFVNFNPVASNVMCSCSGNGELHVWDYKFLKPIKEYSIKDYPNTISWSPNGATIGISEKSKLFHILDPRSGKIILERQISDIFAAQRFSWIDNSSIAIIGWDIQSNKVLNILDIRKADTFSSSILIDKSN